MTIYGMYVQYVLYNEIWKSPGSLAYILSLYPISN